MRFHTLISAVGIAGSLISIPSANAAELVPYSPPVSQASMPATKPTVVLPESFYVDFAAQAKKMNGQQRDELKTSFEAYRINAQQSGDASRAIHYQRLVDILRGAT